MTLRVEPASPAQIALVHRIMLEAFAEYAEVLQPPSSSHLESIDDVTRAVAEGGAIIAWEDEVPAASARYRRRTGYLYVERVAVLPAYRRRGIATALMRFLERLARQLGYDSLQVGVRMSLSGNVALYEALGYRVLRLGPHPRGPDVVGTMLKDLAPSAQPDKQVR
jgi:ribosomal protein S18 acetylase RimI-like enzyme